ncbi:hypothetical protein X801_06562, partial [Opisthorchis viverrini]
MSQSVQNAATRYVNMLTEDFHDYLQRFDQNMRSENEFDEDDVGTEAPLLVIVKEDNNVSELINYDVNLRALFREIVCMDRFSCPIPDLARAMHFRSHFLKTRRNKLQYMLSRVNSMFKRITPELEKLLTVRLYKFYRLYYRGFYEHDWYSALADQWMQ